MNFESCRTVPANHPSLNGHFPGAPIVPGVVILDEVVATLTEERKGSRLVGIRVVKFLQPLKPGQPFTICLSAVAGTEKDVDFSCRVEGRVFVEGRLEIDCRVA
jgi:3-hydroxymyristoyl/3-hydroxydecanoyl-(acyl carrier protein) dehydratase